MIHTFRRRLALLSALLTGIALVAFGLGIWWLIHDIKIDRIDMEVRATAEREASRSRSPDDWQRIEAGLVSILGVRDGSGLLLLVQDGSGNTVFRSSHWPTALDVNRLPWPDMGNLRPFPASDNHAEAMAVASPRTSTQGERDSDPGSERLRAVGPPAPMDTPPRQEFPAAETQQQPDAARPGSVVSSPPRVSTAVLPVTGGQLWRMGLARTENARIAVAVDEQVIATDMKGIRNAFLVSLPAAVLLIGLAGWLFSARATRPLKKLIAAAHRVTSEGLHQRILVQGEDREFVELIDVFNRMLEELGKNQADLERMALHDALTGLPNRNLLLERMQQALARARRRAGRISVLFMDLDGFKAINDTLGHKAGDEALKEITRRLSLVVRQADTLSRLGGDEFVLLVTDLEDPPESGIRKLAEKCIAAVAVPLRLMDADCNLGVSIGIAISDGNGSADRMLATADKAMYEAKKKGRGCYVIAPADHDAEAVAEK